MSKTRIEELRAENVRIHRELTELNEAAQASEDGFGAEAQEKWERLSEQFDKNKAERERLEAIKTMGDDLDQPTRKAVAQAQTADKPIDERTGKMDESARVEANKEYERVFRKHFRYGHKALSYEEQQVLRRGFAREDLSAEVRALGDNPQTTQTAGTGGNAIPDAPMAALQENMLAFGGLLSAPITQIQTSGGNDWPIPTVNDTSNSGAALDENTATDDINATFGQTVLSAFKRTSRFILVPSEFLQDTQFDVVDWVMRALGERLGRGLAPLLINGDGSTEPGGLDLASSFVTAASASAIARDDIIDLIHNVDPAYRRSPAFRLVLGDSTLAALKKLAVGSSDDRPLWVPSMREGAPDTLEGVPYVVDQGVSDIGAGNHSMYAGDLSKFWLRKAGPTRLYRADERFLESDQVGFIAFHRVDSDIIDAGTAPISYLRHPAS